MIVIKNIIWLWVSILIIIVGLTLTLELNFIQFDFKNMFKNLRKQSNNKQSISQVESLMIVLAGRIGVGSISGVAIAIYYGGVGTIFWMWLITLLALPITLAETTLGSKYQEKDTNHIYKGGPSYYMKKGLKNKKIANIYAILILTSYIGGFLTIQSNTITKSINELFHINPILIGLIIIIITFLIIKGGIKKIAVFSTKMVPIMLLIYILTAVFISIKNIEYIPCIFAKIFKEAFNIKAGIGSFLGMVLIGIERGIFSSEAGIGTGAIASSTTEVDLPVKQGYIQMIGVYITTFLVCNSTALIILTSNYDKLTFIDLNGIELANYAFKYHLGSLGVIILLISICLFSFSTILSGYYDGESCLKYFFSNSKVAVKLLKISTLFLLVLGCVLSSTFIWVFIDILIGFIALLNIYSIYALKKEVKEECIKYKKNVIK